MFREMLKLLTKTGKRDLAISSIFFALYGLSSIAMIVIAYAYGTESIKEVNIITGPGNKFGHSKN